jgi:glycosyltransferase involved in cell wall biosynthesis
VARLIPEKGVVELVDAARAIGRTRQDVVFLLAGTGPLLERLRAMVRAAGLERQFKVLGWRNDVNDLMKAADILTLPSYYMEGLPVSILEAMACGKPVVTTHHKGCEDAVVDGQTGYLVPVKAVEPLSEKLIALLDDAALRARMGQAGRRRVEQHYEIDHCTRTIVGVLENAMTAAGAPQPHRGRGPETASAQPSIPR